jgi:hypothetical protein
MASDGVLKPRPTSLYHRFSLVAIFLPPAEVYAQNNKVGVTLDQSRAPHSDRGGTWRTLDLGVLEEVLLVVGLLGLTRRQASESADSVASSSPYLNLHDRCGLGRGFGGRRRRKGVAAKKRVHACTATVLYSLMEWAPYFSTTTATPQFLAEQDPHSGPAPTEAHDLLA